MRLLDPRGDGCHLRSRLLHRDAGLQTTPREKPGVDLPLRPGTVVRAAHQGKPGVDVVRSSHFRAHYADHRRWLTLKGERFTNDSWISLEHALPQAVTDHHSLWSPDFIFVFAECAADLSRQPDDLKKVRGNECAWDLFRISIGNVTQCCCFNPAKPEMLEYGTIPAPVEIIGQRQGKRSEAWIFFIRLGEEHDPFRIWIRKRSEKNGPDNGEDGSICTDAEGQSNDSDRGKAWSFS